MNLKMDVRMDLKIDNMACGGCARSVTRAIQSLDPEARIEANPAERTITLETTATEAAIRQVLEQAGYPARAN